MRMVYLFNHHDAIEQNHVGIRKKILMQMKAFEQCDYDPLFIVYDGMRVVEKNMKTGKVEYAYFGSTESANEYIAGRIKEYDPAFVYMRYKIIEQYFWYDLYNKVAKINDKLICEFYTYPYDTEFSDNDPRILVDKYYRDRLCQFIKYSCNYNNKKEIFSIKSVGISNGIDLDTVSVRNTIAQNKESFDMIAVALMFPWHGYDRIIEGMHLYYEQGGNQKVFLHLIGDGDEIAKYKKLVEKYHLENNVIFYGRVTDRKALDKLFEDKDLAIGSVGMHRLQLVEVSPIKSAEYCARAIPFVINYKDISFDEDFAGIYHVSSDDTPIDIQELINFSNEANKEANRKMMREYAAQNLTWKSQMEKVLALIKE